jgi:hypothetical protein
LKVLFVTSRLVGLKPAQELEITDSAGWMGDGRDKEEQTLVGGGPVELELHGFTGCESAGSSAFHLDAETQVLVATPHFHDALLVDDTARGAVGVGVGVVRGEEEDGGGEGDEGGGR